MECCYCKKTYSSRSSLNYHQKTTKKCLLIQNTIKHQKDSNNMHSKLQEAESKYAKLLEAYNALEAENNIIMTENNELNKMLKKYEGHLNTTLNSKGKTTNNNNINNTNIINIYSRSEQDIKDIYEKNMTVDHVKEGISGISKIILEKIVKNNTVTDHKLNDFTNVNRKAFMPKVYKIVALPENSDDIFDDNTDLYKGYNEIVDDSDSSLLKRRLIKMIK